MTTATTTMTCTQCGKDVEPAMRDLAAFFPRLISPMCEACSDKAAHAEHLERQRLEQEAELNRRRARLEVIPPEMLRTDPKHPEFNRELWLQVREWRPSHLRWLGLVGGAGNCKTRCIALLVRRLIGEGHIVAWTTAVDFQDQVDALRSPDDNRARAARTYLDRLRTAGVLVFDDLGKNTWNNSMERHLFSMLDHRKTHDLPILWSANTHPLEILASKELSIDRGGPIIGRLIEVSKILSI